HELLGMAHAVRGDYAAAEEHLAAAVAAGEAIGVPDLVLTLRAQLGNVAMLRGDLDEARAVHEAVLARAEEGRWRAATGTAWNGLGMVARRAGDAAAAVDAYRCAVAAYAHAANPVGQAEALAGLAFACAA